MADVSLRELSRDNWREALRLGVHPDQQRFIADYAPIAAIALAKAYVRPDELAWVPYAIYADRQMIGLIELAYEPDSRDRYWIYHFFIDRAHQGMGYGKAALQAFVQFVWARHARCRQISLTVHPDNKRAQHLYTRLGFRPTGEEADGEPIYTLQR